MRSDGGAGGALGVVWVMARPHRENVEGGLYHVYARGNAKARIYMDNYDRGAYLALLGRVTTGVRWRCLSYCLMENHVHLLLETPYANLSKGMQQLHGRYAQAFNARHGRVGHLFQGRYGAVRAKSDQQLLAVVAYIARNPVEAGLCQRPSEWPWSSHHAVLAGTGPRWLDIRRLLTHFEDGSDAMKRYVAYVDPQRGQTP